MQFYCGLCLPVYPPFFEYPLFFELNSSATTDEWRAAADFMIQRNVETIYIVPGAGDDAMLRLLAQSGVGIIGGEIPLPDLQNRWITSLRFDLLEAFLDYWPVFANGGDGNTVPVSLSLTDINQELLSPGRHRLADEMIRDVTAGHIDMGVNNSSE